MIGEAYRRFLWHVVDVKRNTTSVSTSGVTKRNYVTILTGVECNLQDGGGRMQVNDQARLTRKKQKAVFPGELIGQILTDDLLVVTNSLGETFRVVHAHQSFYYGAHHLECDLEPYVPAGDA